MGFCLDGPGDEAGCKQHCLLVLGLPHSVCWLCVALFYPDYNWLQEGAS